VINTKKIIFIFIIFLLCLTKGNAAIKDSIFATVGNKPITRSDIINEIKTILILNGQNFSQESADRLEKAAIASTIKRHIKKIEIEKYDGLTFNEGDLYKELNNLANQSNIELDTLKNIFAANGLDFSAIIEQVRVELLWNSLIFQIYKDRLSINISEIDEQLKLIQDKKEIEEFLLSEIIIKPVPKSELNTEIKKIKDKIDIEGFENVAMSLSISESALKGGDLGWLAENIISDNFKSKIINTPVGSISEPIILQQGILFFKIRNRRKLELVVNLDDAKKQLITAEKTKILNMHSLSHYQNLRRSISINYY